MEAARCGQLDAAPLLVVAHSPLDAAVELTDDARAALWLFAFSVRDVPGHLREESQPPVPVG